jgi:hypothetical protein
VKRISDKRLKELGGKVPFSTITTPKKAIRKKPRSKGETLRIYGPPERREWVKQQPCGACGIVGYSQNAHCPPPGESGTGYKADSKWIAPLCGARTTYRNGRLMYAYIGCHRLYDEHPEIFREKYPSLDMQAVAAETERRWQKLQEDAA